MHYGVLVNKYKIANLVLFFMSAGALLAAYVGEHVFHLLPCKLCIVQRIPYFIVLALSIFNIKRNSKPIVFVMTAVILFGAAVAAYNVAIEKNWVEYNPETCTEKKSATSSKDLSAMLDDILNKNAVRCDIPAFVFLGISLAGWNLLASLVVSVGILLFVRYKKS